MDDRGLAWLDELARLGEAHDARETEHRRRKLNITPDTGRLLWILVRAARATRILEIGTSNGYSTIWLGDAVQATGGRLETLDVDPARTALARAHVARAGLAAVVDLRTADAADALRAAPDAAYDLVFLDAERPAYTGYWPDLARVLAPAGLLAVDNVLSHAAQLVAFSALVAADDRVTEALVPIGAGVLLAVRRPGPA